MKTVFLSHRFDFLDPQVVDETAGEFKRLLNDFNVEVVSMSSALIGQRQRDLTEDFVREAVESDLAELQKADILLIDVSLDGWNYIGVTCEMVYAYKWGKPIIAYVGATTNGQRMWLRYHANTICTTLAEVKRAIAKYV